MKRNYLIFLSLIAYCIGDNEYYTYDNIESTLHEWKNQFEDNYHEYYGEEYGYIYKLDTIGISSQDSLPIFAIKLSDNANKDEDEARVLILGQCHAEEIYGVEISMAIIGCYLNPENCYNNYKDYDLARYLIDVIRASLENIELWIVPTHNPEGLKVVHGYCDNDNDVQNAEACTGNWILDRTYRKNIRDANNNTTFFEGEDYINIVGYDEDGVDLNRNYDMHWIHGDPHLHNSSSSNSCYDDDYDKYRGSFPFSETEIQAIKNIALDRSFFLSIAYHSSRSGVVAEKIIFPWGWKYSGQADSDRKLSPDYSVIYILAEKIKDILSFGDNALKPQKSRTGNAHDWLYRETGCIQYLIEVGEFNYQGCYSGASSFMSIHDDEFLIDNKLNDTIVENLEAFFYLLMNAIGENFSINNDLHLSQLTGIVSNHEGNAMEGSIIRILEMDGLVLKPRKTDRFGRYRRLLQPSSLYTMEISAPGYQTDTIIINNLTEGINEHNVQLELMSTYQLELNLQTPENYTGNIQIIKQNSFYSDTIMISENIIWLLPEDKYKIIMTANGLSPIVFEVLLKQSMEYSLNLEIEESLFNEDYYFLSQWEILSGDWFISGDTLRTQSELFYVDGADWSMITQNGIEVDTGDSLIIEISLRYELEWEKDNFSIMYVTENDTNILLNLTGGNYEFYTEHIPLVIPQGQSNGNLLLNLHSDYNLNYRGVEIDDIVIYKSGQYISNALSSLSHVLPDQFTLAQNYPNPFNPSTHINYSVPHLSPVVISIYNVRGELIEKLVDDFYEPGHYTVRFDAKEYSSGIYFYRLQADNSIIIKKFIIIK